MVHQRPLAYLLGLEGVALLRAFAGDYDRDFGEDRITEIRRLLDDPSLSAEGVEATRVDTVDGYGVWSATYDQPGNGLLALEQPVVHDILDSLPTGGEEPLDPVPVVAHAVRVHPSGPPRTPPLPVVTAAPTVEAAPASPGRACVRVTAGEGPCGTRARFAVRGADHEVDGQHRPGAPPRGR